MSKRAFAGSIGRRVAATARRFGGIPSFCSVL